MKALAARRILITRARHQAQELASALEEQGAEVLAIPAIEIIPPDSYEPLDQALRNVRNYRWIVLTSVNGVEALIRRMESLGLPLDALHHAKLVAIGPATARALAMHGLRADVTPKAYIAESLVDAVRERVAGQNVLLVRARVAREVIPDELRKAGARVDVVDAYQTVIPAASRDAVRNVFTSPASLPHAIAFTSSSTAINCFRLLHEAGFPTLPPGIAAVSIGPVTSRTLREQGTEPAAEAAESTIPGLIAALCLWSAAPAHKTHG